MLARWPTAATEARSNINMSFVKRDILPPPIEFPTTETQSCYASAERCCTASSRVAALANHKSG